MTYHVQITIKYYYIQKNSSIKNVNISISVVLIAWNVMYTSDNKNHLQIIFRVFCCCSIPSSREGSSPPCYLSTLQLSYPINQMYKLNFLNIWVFLSWRHTVYSKLPEAQLLKIDKTEVALFKVGVGLGTELTYHLTSVNSIWF